MAELTRATEIAERVCVGGRIDAGVNGLKRTFLEHLLFTEGRFVESATANELYTAVAYTVRDQLLYRWIKTVEKFLETDVKVVGYLSAEFLLGPHLENNLINLGIYDEVQKAVKEAGFDLRKLIE